MARNSRRRAKARSKVRRIVKIPAEYFAALDVGTSVFPSLYQFENGLRLVLHNFLTTCYGPDWWDLSLQQRLPTVFAYARDQRAKLDAMAWLGSSTAVNVLPVHLITLGQLEEIVKAYRSDCIPEVFPTIEFFLGHMELIKRIRNMYSHMFPCITRADSLTAKSEIRTLARHINSKL